MALPLPLSHLIIDGKEVELFRCDTDGGIVICSRDFDYDSQASFRAHSGHKLKQPVVLKDGEMQEILDELSILDGGNG